MFGDEGGVMVVSGHRYVAVIEKPQSFIQLSLQTGAETTLIDVWATVQNHFSGLGRISETQYKDIVQQE